VVKEERLMASGRYGEMDWDFSRLPMKERLRSRGRFWLQKMVEGVMDE
jgi:hypothetical protein